MDGEIERRLTTIVAADVAEFSRLVAEDEEATLAAFRDHRKALIDPLIGQHGGRIANTAGDSLLVEFPSAVEAVRCALAVQKGLAARNGEVREDRRIRLRIGINVGDVVADGGDLLGDGVNVAARLEALADPGGICMSRTARDQVRDHVDLELHDLGEVPVKNIARPVRVFKVTTGEERAPAPFERRRRAGIRQIALGLVVLAAVLSGAGWWWQQRAVFEPADPERFAHALPDKTSIAVLPFDNRSADPAHADLAGVVSDELNNNLARISSFFVISQQAAQKYRNGAFEVRQVAEELGVRNVVLGSVQRIGDRVRVNAQLVDVLSGQQFWTGTFDREVTDIFALQDDITRAIAIELSANLSWSAGARQTDNVEAYLIWRSVQGSLLPISPERLAHAGSMAKKAIALDPDYSRAHALLGLVRTWNGHFGYVEARDAALAEGLELARKAVALADNDWYAHFVHAQALMHTRDYRAAAAAYERAIALDPANAPLLTLSSLPLIFLGRPDDAIARLQTATRLNPFQTWMPQQFMGMALYLKGNYDTALAHLERAAETNPEFIGNWLWRAAAYAQAGERERARELTDRILERQPDTTISGNFIQFQHPDLMETLREGWRKAGIPD